MIVISRLEVSSLRSFVPTKLLNAPASAKDTFKGLSVTGIRVEFAVGSFEGLYVGTSVTGIRVGCSVGIFEGVEVGDAVGL